MSNQYIATLSLILMTGTSTCSYASDTDTEAMGKGHSSVKSETRHHSISHEKEQLGEVAKKVRNLRRDLMDDIRNVSDTDNILYTDEFLQSGLRQINVLEGYMSQLTPQQREDRLVILRDGFNQFKQGYMQQNLGDLAALKYNKRVDGIVKQLDKILGEDKKLAERTGSIKNNGPGSPAMTKAE